MNRRKDVFVDLGTSFITLLEGGSVLTRQPNIGMFTSNRGRLELLSYGGAIVDNGFVEGAEIITPVVDGVLLNAEAQTLILKQLFKDLRTRSVFDATRVYVATSSALTALEQDELEKTFNNIGYRDVVLVESVLATLPHMDYKTSLVAIYGGGSLEVAVVGKDGIVSACSLNLGGNAITSKVIDYVYEKYNLKISKASAERLKTTVLSLTKDDLSSAEVSGRDIVDGRIKSVVVTGEMFRPSISELYLKTADTIRALLTTIPARLVAPVRAEGLKLFGGGAEMRGLEDFLSQELGIPVTTVPSPGLAVIKGMSRLTTDGLFQL